MEKWKLFRTIFIVLMSAFLILNLVDMILYFNGWISDTTHLNNLTIGVVISSIAFGNAILWAIFQTRSNIKSKSSISETVLKKVRSDI